jgi:hypothetical protein
MKPENWIGVAQICITLVGILAGPWIAVRWSLSQFRSTKWWERQEQIYTNAITLLSFVKFGLTQRYLKCIGEGYYTLNNPK